MNSTTFKSAPPLGLRNTELYFLATCFLGYRWRVEFIVPLHIRPGYLSYPSYRIFDLSTQLFSVSSSHSHSLYFLELFQLKVERFFIYFDQFVQNALYVIILQDLCLIRWRLLSSGLNECNRKKETPSQTQ